MKQLINYEESSLSYTQRMSNDVKNGDRTQLLNHGGTSLIRAQKMFNDIKNGDRTQHTLVNYGKDFEEIKYDYINSYRHWLFNKQSCPVFEAEGGTHGEY